MLLIFLKALFPDPIIAFALESSAHDIHAVFLRINRAYYQMCYKATFPQPCFAT